MQSCYPYVVCPSRRSPSIASYGKQAILLFGIPPLHPHLHLIPAFLAGNIHRWNDPPDTQGAAEHGQLAERTVFAIGHAKAGALSRAAALRGEVFAGVW